MTEHEITEIEIEIIEEEVRRDWFEIPESNIEWLQGKIDKLNKKANKLGCPEITIEVLEERLKEVEDQEGMMIKIFHIKIHGEAPSYNGYKFIGTIQYVDEIGNILRTVPEEEMPVEYRKAKIQCDHCQTKRFRRDTFVVKNLENNEYKQVGRQCLKDFLGHADPKRLADWAETIAGLDELGEEASHRSSTGRDPKYISTEDYLAYVAATIRHHGWLSRTKARETEYGFATADRAYEEMFPSPYLKAEDRAKLIKPEEEDKELAKVALEWARGLGEEVDPDSLNEYLYNVWVVSRQGALQDRSLGIAASIIASYKRTLEKAKETKEHNKIAQNSQHVGEVGQKITVVVKVLGVFELAGYYGSTYIYRMLGADGNLYKWFSSREVLDEEATYTVTGTIKGHDEWKETKFTILTRCKCQEGIVEVPEPKVTKDKVTKPRTQTTDGAGENDGNKINKSQLIRVILAEGISVKDAVVEMQKRHNIEVRYQAVYQVAKKM